MRVAVIFPFLAAVPVAAVLAAASLPTALRGGGLWEVSTKASGLGGARHCLSDSAILAQWEHRQAQCTRVVLSATADRSDVQYTCAAGGFGSSKVQVLTPRSVRIQTQGISGGLPFGYTVHARRVGTCEAARR